MRIRYLTVPMALLTVSVMNAKERPQPNVIFILVDDMGYGDMSCHGNPVFKTKHLDRLHDESIRFTQFHVTPMSTPSRGQLLTGCEALRNGASWVGTDATHLRTDIPVLLEVMRSAGYRTALFGKWHLGDNYPLRPQDRGFDYTLTYPQQEVGTVNDYWYNDYFDDVYIENGVRKQFKGFCTDVWFQEALKWIDVQRTSGQPFFCYIPTNVTHGPYFAPKEYLDKVLEQSPGLSRDHTSFVATMLNLDDNIGRLLDYVASHGLSENTIILFMTDNGVTMGYDLYNAGMRGLKTHLWEGGHRVPWFIRLPGEEGKDISGLTQAEDVFPTLLELCGIEVPSECHFDGISLAKQITSNKPVPDRILVNQFQRRKQIKKYDACIMWGPWRLLNGIDTDPKDEGARKAMYDARKRGYQIHLELYNVEEDPHQDNNVYEQYPEIVAKLKDYYDQWWNSIEPELDVRGQIVIGHPSENPTMLSATSWKDKYFTQKSDVLQGRKVSDEWVVQVDSPGRYRFRVYRWSPETRSPLRSAINMYYTDTLSLGPYSEGKALDICRSVMNINGDKQSCVVRDGDLYAEFEYDLPEGPADIGAEFYDRNGALLCGAYYVEVYKKD